MNLRGGALAACLLLVLAGCAPSDERDLDAASTETATPLIDPSEEPSLGPEPTATDAATNRLRFLAIGDFGSGSAEQYAIAHRMCKVLTNRTFQHVVTVGDNVYDEGHPDRFEEVFFRPYRCLLDGGVRFHAVLGNHDIRTDGGRPELEEPAFGMKARNYVWRAGGVRFVMANSNNFNFDWLRRALVAEAGDRWTVVVFHHPVYASGVYGPTPGLRPRLPRMFRNHGVDLVLNGHEHHYEVSKELRGIRYVVTGGGGASVRPCGEPRWFRNVCLSRFHFLEVVAGPDQILVKAIPARGRSFHRFTTDGRD